jgi:hypothetical protein
LVPSDVYRHDSRHGYLDSTASSIISRAARALYVTLKRPL